MEPPVPSHWALAIVVGTSPLVAIAVGTSPVRGGVGSLCGGKRRDVMRDVMKERGVAVQAKRKEEGCK